MNLLIEQLDKVLIGGLLDKPRQVHLNVVEASQTMMGPLDILGQLPDVTF